jgi:hypothetical protein
MYSKRDFLFSIPENSMLEQAKGGFAKRVFVAIQSEPAFPENINFLSKILTAAGLNLEQDTMFAELDPDPKTSFLPLVKEKQAECILVFGITPKQLGLNINCPLYQPFDFYGTTFLFADSLSRLEPDKTLKAKLWQALQQLFLKGL